MFFIRASKVVGLIPNNSAAPSAPLIFQCVFPRMASKLSRSLRCISASAVGMTVLAAMLADSLWFCLGRKSGERALPVLSRWARSRNISLVHAKTAVVRHGLWTLTVAKFLPGTVMPSLAGALGMSARRFALFDGLAALFYAGCYVTTGYLFHNQVQQVMVWFDRVCHGVIGLGVILVVGYIGYKYALWRRKKRPYRKMNLAGKGANPCAGIPCLDAANLMVEE
jgi:membrane protein DedA with SNARE-associated domain